MNEVTMVLADTKFRLLDENPELGLLAQSEEVPPSIGINLFVEDIYAQAKVAEELGCETLSPITDFGRAINTVIKDAYGFFWIINQDMEKGSTE